VLSRLPVPARPARTAPPAADSTPLGAIPPSPPAGAAAPAETVGPADQPKPAISPTAPDNPPPGPAEDLTPAPEAGPAAVAPRPETTAAYPDDAEPPTDDDQDPGGAIPARLTTFANLPAEVRNALPELTIGAHYYAKNPAARMVGINGRIVRQGQTVAPGLILEEITREGVIFSFHNRRFSREVFAR
jgi:general secretion pathway protein B